MTAFHAHRAGNRFLMFFLLFASLLLPCIPGLGDGTSRIPPQLASSYRYGTNDDSVIIAKERLRELGYFSAKADLTGRINDTLKSIVKEFQKKNNMKQTGTLDTSLFTVLFSDEAVGRHGQQVPWTQSPFYSLISTSSAPLSQIVALIQEAGEADYTLFRVSVCVLIILCLILILLRVFLHHLKDVRSPS